jgi:hypothetical protein
MSANIELDTFHKHAPVPEAFYSYPFSVKIDRFTLETIRLLDEHRIEYSCEVVDMARYLRAVDIYEKAAADREAERQRQRDAELRERKI